MRKWRFVVVAMLATLSIVAAACGKSTSTGANSKPAYKIGFMGALTGPNAQLVIGSEKGANLAIKQANDKGDLPVTLSLDPQDTLGAAASAVPLASKLAGDSSILGVVGPAFSGESLAANPTIQQASIPQITPSATNPALAQAGWKEWFRAVGNDNSQGGPAPDVAEKILKGAKIYVADDNSAYGKGLATIVANGVTTKYPGALVGTNSVDPGKDDYSDLANKIVTSKANVFFWGGYSPEAAKIITQARAKGFTGTYLGADGSKDTTFLTNTGANGEGAYFLCPCADVGTITDPVDTKFVSDYKAFTNSDPIIYSGEGYDSTNLIINAIRKAGKPGSDITTYRKTLGTDIGATTGFVGTTKTYAFQPNGELVDSAVVIYLYKVVGGKFVLQGKVNDLLAKA
jgi:branched-chain amino acid transport system substrate-binding protein